MGKPKTKVTREQRMYLTLKDSIYSGVLLPGSRLMEMELSKVHGVSRAVVRAVLRRLEAEGYLEIEPYKGARVAVFSPVQIAEMLEVLEVLDGLAARLAAKRKEPDGLDRLREVLGRLEQAYSEDDVFGYIEVASELHVLINNLAGNNRLFRIMEPLRVQAVRYVFVSIVTAARMRESVRDHRRLVDAICSGDAAAAERIARLHIVPVKDSVGAQDARVPGGRTGPVPTGLLAAINGSQGKI